MIAPETGGDNPQLRTLIIEAIHSAPQARLTFERFMEMALYQPKEGYYTHRGGLIGARGDFYTAPHLTPIFGELISQQIVQFWQRLGCPVLFQVVETGAGQGLLASDILANLYRGDPALWQALRYTIVEISEPLRVAQRRRLEAVPNGPELVAKTQWRSLNEFAPGEIDGCFVSNELLDAFPVHLVTLANGRWQEIYVAFDAQASQFEEVSGPLSNPALASYLDNLNLNLKDYEDGYRTEINLGALDWLETVSQALGRGYILTIDYGYPAAQRYQPRRRAGTLQCYSSHQVNDNPYINIGRQDITSHVDFSALLTRGEELGLRTEGFTRQANFLLGLGLGERLAAINDPAYRVQAGLTTKQQLAEREALQRLINPTVLGNFGVLIQSRQVPPGSEKLKGLSLEL